MGQEFFIKSEQLESKIRQLLPSQGGLGAGVDLSGSTQIVPIVDLTESAEGSNLRADLQTATDFATSTIQAKNVTNTTVTSTPGFYKVYNCINGKSGFASLNIFDGTTSKDVFILAFDTTNVSIVRQDVIFLRAGDTLRATSSASTVTMDVFFRQIADVSGELTNPQGF